MPSTNEKPAEQKKGGEITIQPDMSQKKGGDATVQLSETELDGGWNNNWKDKPKPDMLGTDGMECRFKKTLDLIYKHYVDNKIPDRINTVPAGEIPVKDVLIFCSNAI